MRNEAGQNVQLLDADFEGTSYQSWPQTDAPYLVRGAINMPKSRRIVTIAMTREQAEDTVKHLCSFLGITVTGISTGKS